MELGEGILLQMGRKTLWPMVLTSLDYPWMDSDYI